MKTPEISDWLDALERVHAIVAATAATRSMTLGERALHGALAELEMLHDRMLRAEVRVTVAKTATFGA